MRITSAGFCLALVFAPLPLQIYGKAFAPIFGADDPDSTNWIDSVHNYIYGKSHGSVEWFDDQFVPDGEKPIPLPPSRFRLGLFSEFDFGKGNGFQISPVVDFKTDVHLPNLEHRLRLFVTTEDQAALPGDDPLESNNALRIGATRDLFKNWDTSLGVKARWPPEVFANVQWSRKYDAGTHWSLYPRVKLFWDSKDKFGYLGSLVGDRWQDRWLFRQTLSFRWDGREQEDDSDDANDPDNSRFGEDGGGYRWESSTVVGYVPLLIDERDYGRTVRGSDVADGWGARGRVVGDIVQPLTYEISLFRKGRLYKNYLFYTIVPLIEWDQDEDWDAEFGFRIGVEMLLWGDDPLRRPSTGG
ncbi:MAG: hypothetical protein AAGJ81_06280 [Verrucomicrobiota bacterium]